MKRIQRKRTQGWKMPENTIYTGRPSKWGNPFKLDPDGAIRYYSANRRICDPWVYWSVSGGFATSDIIALYKAWITGKLKFQGIYRRPLPSVPDIEELRGKDLACWCALDKPCHTDVLIKLLKQ